MSNANVNIRSQNDNYWQVVKKVVLPETNLKLLAPTIIVYFIFIKNLLLKRHKVHVKLFNSSQKRHARHERNCLLNNQHFTQTLY